jgi:hypothetical protein
VVGPAALARLAAEGGAAVAEGAGALGLGENLDKVPIIILELSC